MKTIGDLISVPDVRTVIHLSDVENPKYREALAEDFVPTGEVEDFLLPFARNVAEGEGMGFFITGNYGSGKSHLLTVLQLLLEDEGARDNLCSKVLSKEIRFYLEQIKSGRYLVLPISLLSHSAREYLEDIVADALSIRVPGVSTLQDKGQRAMVQLAGERYPGQLKDFLKKSGLDGQDALFSRENQDRAIQFLREMGLPYRFSVDREAVFSSVQEMMEAQGIEGLVILFDELSEFLRSKRDARAFNEDIRYLQFLGEYSKNHPLWVVATLQEQIEETGDISPEYFKKIVDRYHRKCRLTGRHVMELIDTRLIKKKEGALEEIDSIYTELREALGDSPFTRDDLLRSYPIHPQTVRLLDELRSLFSEHRGIVDFIHYQIKGDPDRGISGILNEEISKLVTPDLIFDHFRERIRETVEFRDYSEKVFDYYQREAGRISLGDNPIDTQRLVKLLILTSISPHERRVTPKDAAQGLLFRIIDTEPEINYDYAEELLENVVKAGAYVSKAQGSRGDAEYYIDLGADLSLKVQRRLEYLKGNLFEEDSRVLYLLAPWVESPLVPLTQWTQEGQWKANVTWQNTPREAIVRWGELGDIDSNRVEEMLHRLRRDETDFILFIGTPFDVGGQKKHAMEEIRPAFKGEGASFAFWYPRSFEPGELESLKGALAYRLFFDELELEETSDAAKLKEYILPQIEDEKKRISHIYTDIYSKGQIISGNGDIITELARVVQLNFDNLLQEVASFILTSKYPLHSRIAPTSPIITEGTKNRLISSFFRAEGSLSERMLDPATRLAVTGYLLPMNLAKRSRKGELEFNVSPKDNPLIREVLTSFTDEAIKTEDLYMSLRKSRYGLSRDSFELLLLSLIFKGLVVPMSDGRRLPINNITGYNIGKIDGLERGELLDIEFQRLLQEIPWISKRFKDEAANLGGQRGAWDEVVSFKTDLSGQLEHLQAKLREVEGYSAGELLPLDKISQAILEVREVLDEIKVSYSPVQGLQRFLSAYRAHPRFDEDVALLVESLNFFQEKLGSFVHISKYLERAMELIPDGEKYQEIRAGADEAMALLKPGSIMTQEGMELLEVTFASFQSQYIHTYLQEHEGKSSASLERYREFLKTPEAELLKKLGKIEALSIEDSYLHLEATIDHILSQRCDNADRDLLTQTPECTCHFRLGDRLDRAAIADIKARAIRGVRNYGDVLSNPPISSAILEYAKGLEAIGKSPLAKRLRDLVIIDSADPDIIKKLEEAVDRNVIGAINSALAGHMIVEEKDLNELYDLLVGRVFTKDQIFKEITRWLGSYESGGGKEERYYRLKARGTLFRQEVPGVEVKKYHDLEDILRFLSSPPDKELPQTILALGEGLLQELQGINNVKELEGISIELAKNLGQAPKLGNLLNLSHFPERVESRYLIDQINITGYLLCQIRITLHRGTEAIESQEHRAWEHFYSAGYSDLDWMSAWLTICSPLRRFLYLEGATLLQDIRSFKGRVTSIFKGSSPGKDVSQFLLKDTGEILRRVAPSCFYILILDGVRWDLFQALMNGDHMRELQLMDGGILWAVAPTTTERQIEEWRRNGWEGPLHSTGDTLGFAPEEFLIHDNLNARGPKRWAILKTEWFDEKLHASNQNYWTLMEEMRLGASKYLYPFLHALPEGALILLASDHGYSVGQDAYSHGGVSLEEVLVPWAIYQRK